MERDEKLLSEERLRHISRHMKTTVPSTALTTEAINEIRTLLGQVCKTAATSNLNAVHRVAAWNTLCAMIDRCLTVSDPALRDVVVAEYAHEKAFEIYLSQSHNARPKASKQLLGTINTALCILSDGRTSDTNKSHIADMLIGHLVHGDDNAKAKASAMALGHFLSKGALELTLILEKLHHVTLYSDEFGTFGSTQQLLLILFRWLGKSDFGSSIGHLVAIVLDKHDATLDTQKNVQGTPVWAGALKEAHNEVAINIADLRVHVLPLLLKRSMHDYTVFLQDAGLSSLINEDASLDGLVRHSSEDLELLYAALQTGKELGLLHETAERSMRSENGILLIPLTCIERLLSSSSRAARLTGLSLLISSHTATRPIPPESLRLLHLHIGHFFADTDANFRGEVFSLVQRLIDRIRAITAVLARQISKPNLESGDAFATLQAHRAFLDQLLRLITWNLRPAASYQRHLSASKCLAILVRSGVDDTVSIDVLSKSALGEARWPFSISVVSSEVQRLLLDLLVDPFDDVRQTAAAILLFQPQDPTLGRDALSALKRAEAAMLATGRADQADGVAHIYALLHRRNTLQSVEACIAAEQSVVSQLVKTLQSMLHIAQDDLSTAVERYPIHGLLTSLRYVFIQNPTELTEDIYGRLVISLHEIWAVVKPILCNDAPEGYLPEDLEAVAGVSTKNTLSYCWRALKEGSLLLGVLVSADRAASSKDDGVEVQRMTSLSELCFTQLAELRHRGAFSTVAQTWSICCTRGRDLQARPGLSQLQSWYDQVVLILRNKTTINTRRSAGLPSLLCGVLVADQSGKLMQQAFSDLESVARNEVDAASTEGGSLPQVHAMNCLKDVLKNSKLGEQSEHYVARSLQLAADALRAESWAIRNCGLMLFRAVIDRLFGTSEAVLEDDGQKCNKLSIEQYPQLFEIVLDQLATVSISGEHNLLSTRYEGLFPALQLLRRLQIPAARLSEVERYVQALLGSPVWHVRDKAASTYAALPSKLGILQKLEDLLSNKLEAQNTLHGALLCARYLIKDLVAQQNDLNDTTTIDRPQPAASHRMILEQCCLLIADAAQRLFNANGCFITKKAYLDVYSECLQAIQTVANAFEASDQPASNGDQRISTMTLLPLQGALEQGIGVGSSGNTADKLLTPTLARAYALQLPFAFDRVQQCLHMNLIERLATADHQACVSFIVAAKTHLHTGPVWHSMSAAAVEGCASIMRSQTTPVRLRHEALRALLHLVAITDDEGLPISDIISPMSAARTVTDTTDQVFADLSIELQAACIECHSRIKGRDDNDDLLDDFTQWIAACENAMAGSGLNTHEAVGLSIEHLHTSWSRLARHPLSKMPYLRLCLVVYDLLNDDDEDMRLIGSRATGRILSADVSYYHHTDLSPLVASQRLVNFISRRWSDDAEMASLALQRAFGVKQQNTINVCDRLSQHEQSDTALFAEEKQNLYIDEVREVKVWSQVLLRLDLRRLTWSSLECLSEWTTEGLQTLTTKLTVDADGPLGWTTNVEIFTLGLQVIYAAELLFHLSTCGRRLPVRASHLRRSFAEFATACVASHANCLWLSEAERVLARSVTAKLLAVQLPLLPLTQEAKVKSME